MLGLGVFDCLARDMTDPDTGEFYPALSCCNDKAMAERCTVQGAPKVIWSIKASAQFNSDCAFLLREGFRSGRIRLLMNEFEAEEKFKEIRGFQKLPSLDQMKFMLPYIQTTLLVDELVNLQHEEYNGKLKIYEKSGRRKDRYSSLSYSYYVAVQLENKYAKRQNYEDETEVVLCIRAPRRTGGVVNTGGSKTAHTWG